MTPTKSEKNSAQPETNQLSYEQALSELETIVTSLESNKLALEETMSLFERGQQLIKYCVELLDKTELRVKQLSGGSLTDLDTEE